MSTSYFRVERSATTQAGPRWRAAATIVRADTDEVVQRLAVRAASAFDADDQLDAALAAALAALAPPADWGRDPTVPHLLQRYLQLRDEVYGMVEAGAADAEAYDRREQAKLRAQVEVLTEAQLLELTSATPDQVVRHADPYVQDVLTAKRELARFITRPSPALQAALDRLTAALNQGEPGA